MIDSSVMKLESSYSNFIWSLDEDDKKKYYLTKRFLEIYTGNDQLRNIINMGVPLETLDNNFKDTNLTLSDFLPIFDTSIVPTDLEKTEIEKKWPYANIWWRYVDTVQDFRKKILETGSTNGLNNLFDVWRQRQINRTAFELGPKGSGIIHAPIAFELSDGCSVGCWFCGISAEKFKGHYSLKEDNGKEWKEILHATKKILGSGMRSGFCYWGTDPLDNPEYLDILKIYDEIVGVVPQTTTAIPLKNIELTKSVLEFWKVKKNYPIRFSILTKAILQKVHDQFTAEELFGVEMVLQNTGAMHETKTGAGRAYSAEKEKTFFKSTKSKKSKKVMSDATIACVSGFLINIVTKKIRLITPTLPSEEWKDGFKVISENTYSDPENLHEIMIEMINTHMYSKINHLGKIKLNNTIRITEDENVYFESPNVKMQFSYSKKILDLILSGKYSALDLVCNLTEDGTNPLETFHLIDFLWMNGFIETE
ncbi:radical SAM family RiPP maturation amino acid epimerase [Acinetobacter calcoaceticus]|uniref:radical SAM family RiPP maturation amino acid epimerase n=1 Tax=Acinetobacter calcoaceticus TaxID=471 RepID=UPI00285C9BC3|nr:radical SAM family RiPP maturation amino acid epimerase [Acinetobacter calcoaceticus]MDR6798328.1 radical SAM family RiPP maturation amino acid epimerase [Acinetobacter calcoaceticus]